MPTTEIKTVKPAGGGDYTTVNAWDVGERSNLVTSDKVKIAEVYGGGNCITGATFAPGTWTTDATRYAEVRAAVGHEHAGTFDNTKAYGETTTGGYVFGGFSGTGLRFFRVRRMQLRSTFSDANSFIMVLLDSAGTGRFIVDGCLLLKDGASTFAVLHIGANNSLVMNTVMKRVDVSAAQSGRGVYVQDTSTCVVSILNCAIVMQADNGGSIGVRVDSGKTGTTQNCYIRAGISYQSAGTLNQGSKDATANADATDVGLRNVAWSTANFVNVTIGSEDFHIVTASVLKDAGVDLSGSGVTTDFEGQARPFNSVYDIGADEFIPVSIAVEWDDVLLQQADWNNARFSSSVMAKSKTTGELGYLREGLVSTDRNAAETKLKDSALREAASYHSIPPSYFHPYKSRIALGHEKKQNREDGVRSRSGLFQDGNSVYLNGPCVVAGSIPHTYINPFLPCSAEQAIWAASVYLDRFSLKFSWLPTFSFVDVVDSTMELLRVEEDANNYISLSLVGGAEFEREYVPNEVYGPHNPILRLIKVRASATVDSIDMSAFYFGDSMSQNMDLPEEAIEIEISHHAGALLALRVNRHGTVGDQTSREDTVAYGFSGKSDLKLSGVGYFSEPTLLLNQYSAAEGTRRQVPSGRSDLIKRSYGRSTSILGGERDPTAGQAVSFMPFVDTDSFDRADGAIGSDWTAIKTSGAGWSIISNRASCAQTDYRYWTGRRPSHRDYIAKATLAVNVDNDLVGVLVRIDLDAESTRAKVYGYGVELVQTGASAASLKLVRFYNDSKDILETVSLSSYTTGTEYVLKVITEGNVIAGQIFSLADTGFTSPLATVSETDLVFDRPGLVGFYGVTGGAGQRVTLNDWSLTPNFEDSSNAG